MTRILTAALLAAPLLLAVPGRASAYGDGPCSYGYGCGGLCLNLFSRIHQHGPLYNYGPYYGYPPFEPHGPWDAWLHYTEPPATAKVKVKEKVHNPHPLFGGGLGSLFHKNKGGDCATGGTPGCSSCGGGGHVGGPVGQPYAQSAPYNPYQQNPNAGYAYGYNPYAAAAASGAYYSPYMTQPAPYQPGVTPAGQYR